MNASDVIALVAVVAGAMTTGVGWAISARQHNKSLAREDRLRREQRDDQDQLFQDLRIRVPQIEFDLSCNQIGRLDGHFVVEFQLSFTNRGNVKMDFESIVLRVRSLRYDDPARFMSRRPYTLELPHKLFEVKIVPEDICSYSVEPHVRQIISFATMIDNDVQLILAHAIFVYGRRVPDIENAKRHIAERAFQLSAGERPTLAPASDLVARVAD